MENFPQFDVDSEPASKTRLRDYGKEIPSNRERAEPVVVNSTVEALPLDAHYADMGVQPTHAAMINDLDACQHHLTKYIWRWNRGKHDGTRDLHAARKLLGQYIHYEETGDWVNQDDLPPELR
jgi:hypothetical protein